MTLPQPHGWRKMVVVLCVLGCVTALDWTGHPLSSNARDTLIFVVGLFFGANAAENWKR